jgi:two-component system chemotaxis response regulator CheB
VKTKQAPDVVVIGASAGGVKALQTLVSRLPDAFNAAVLVVLHVRAEVESFLPDILRKAGVLPAVHAADGSVLEAGRIYIAPPDCHLLFHNGYLRVIRGPKENRHRPSIDVLFRSAAMTHGNRVVGVLLTGADDDGTAGLLSIKRSGGVTVVQAPEESEFPRMPQSALTAVKPDFVLSVAEIGPLLGNLVKGLQQPTGRPVMMEADERPPAERVPGDDKGPGVPTAFSCPDCNGTLWELHDGDLIRYRCRVGHAYSAATALDAESEAVERALWEAVRVLEESASMSRRIASKTETLREQLNRKAEERDRHAQVIRELLLSTGS